MTKLAAVTRLRASSLQRQLESGGELASRFAGLFLWPVVLAAKTHPLASRLEPLFIGKKFAVDAQQNIVRVGAHLLGPLYIHPARR